MRDEFIDVLDATLDEWLELLRNPPKGKLFIRNMFPTSRHRTDWLQTSETRTEKDVRLLLRCFLVSTGSNRMDNLSARFVFDRIRNGVKVEDLSEHDRHLILYVRSMGKYPVWEGLSWVLDLLPSHPRHALNVLDAHFYAYYDELTDNYLTGLFDAQAVIRNRYIESSHTKDRARDTLQGLTWRELEWLCGILYDGMGWKVTVTPRSDDDGVDVFATRDKKGEKALTLIQSKKYVNSNPVAKKDLRELLGSMDKFRAGCGVLVTTGRFESGAVAEAKANPRLETVDCAQLLTMLNEYCGADWYTRIDRLLANFKREHASPKKK